jgi:RNA polymerase sigma-B factor
MNTIRRPADRVAPEVLGDWLAQYRADPSRALRNRIVEASLHLVDHHVGRFSRSPGASPDDLRQTAYIALVNAVERFDPEKGAGFATFASRTIEGALKRYLRDRTWAVRPPRAVQELALRLRGSQEELGQRLGRAPTVAELASDVGASTEAVLEAFDAGRSRVALGIDAPVSRDPVGALAQSIGLEDPAFERVDGERRLASLLSSLDGRERLVLRLRFVDELTQPEIAERVGVSQSYVSRLLRRSLTRLRHELGGT